MKNVSLSCRPINSENNILLNGQPIMKAPWKNLTEITILLNDKLTKDFCKLFAKCKWPKLARVKLFLEDQD